MLLIDYGDILEDVSPKSCIRILPKNFELQKPLAYVVKLAGLRPVTIKIDPQEGYRLQCMTPTLALKWSDFSCDLVINKIWTRSPHKLARLHNWRRDRFGDVHGELVFLGFKREINLNKLLIYGGHGDYFENLFKKDLEAKKGFKRIGNLIVFKL